MCAIGNNVFCTGSLVPLGIVCSANLQGVLFLFHFYLNLLIIFLIIIIYIYYFTVYGLPLLAL